VRQDDRFVLVVDDYPTMRRLMRNLLAELGFANVEMAEDGRSALKKLRERPFDLVISDWNMMPMSGLDLLRIVREDDDLKDLPFIMITAANTAENVVAAKEVGVNGYIVKPFTAETLQRRIDSVLGTA
jgi:two-component system, chemotaxis family, chemotaxis protein CheY